MIVADTNLTAYLLMECPQTETARAVWEADRDWMVPALWRHEFANFLVTAVRAGLYTPADALGIWSSAAAYFDQAERAVPMNDVISTAHRHSVTAYDAEFVVLAKALDVHCVTEDRVLLKAFPGLAVSMRDFLDERRKPAVREPPTSYGRRTRARKST